MQKWKRIAMAGIVAGVVTLGILPAWAQNTDSPVVEARQERQQQRIQQGVDSGQFTGKEFNRLEREQGRIATAEARMKSDGNLTVKERARLHNMQDRASRHIYRAKHNKRRAQSRAHARRAPTGRRTSTRSFRRCGSRTRSRCAGPTASRRVPCRHPVPARHRSGDR